MKRKNEAGFSLVETLVAIVILTGIVIPILASLALSTRLNAKAESILQARIAVSSAVETLKAGGIDKENDVEEKFRVTVDAAPVLEGEDPVFYTVTVADGDSLVSVTTVIRAAGEEGTE